jgi:hypothetical protein|tara:strand:+ start:295 stop:879 length:585 start_codon:yes stop_codon:yes gene_type:complete
MKEKKMNILDKINEWSIKTLVWFSIAFWPIFILFMLFSQIVEGDELVHKFKSPSFSGIGTSSHYLTIENQEFSRRKAIADDIEAAILAAKRDAENTTMAKFMRNLESRIYAQLSKQLVDSLFSTCSAEGAAAGTCSESSFGSFVLEGNVITYQRTSCDASIWTCTQGEEVIVMTIVAEDGSETTIVIPVGAGTG